MYLLIIIWYTGEKEIYHYPTEEKAKEIEAGYKKAFRNQIAYSYTRRA